MNQQLLKLLNSNKGKGLFKAEVGADEATIYIYDVIVSDSYWGGISAIDFAKQLASITAPIIHLRLQSPGGDVFAARAMVQAIKDHPSKIIAHVDGMAASAATFLVVAADESVISDGAMFMIHNAWTIAAGNANDFTEMAALLSRTDQTIINDYTSKTGKSDDEIKTMMAAETYFFGEEAVDAGFIDALAESTPKNKINWDLSAYDHAPAIESRDQAETLAAVIETHEPVTAVIETPDPDLTQHYLNLNRLRMSQASITR